MKETLDQKIKLLVKKAKGLKDNTVNTHLSPNSLADSIKTKEQADHLRRQLKWLLQPNND